MNTLRTLLAVAALSTASVAGFAQTADAPKPAAAASWTTTAGKPAQAKKATHKRAHAKARTAKHGRASGKTIDDKPATQ